MNRRTILAWLTIGLTIASFFGSALITGRPLALRDSAHFYYPLFRWSCSEWAAGRVPLWSALENCGSPILADTTSSVLYPGKLIFAIPIDFERRFNLYLVSHVVLAAAGSYLLARMWRVRPAGAALAAVSYACGGSVAFQYCNVVFLVGAAWLPWALACAARMLVRASWPWAVFLGAVLSLLVLGGDPQTAYHVLLASALYAVVLWRRKAAERISQNSVQRKELRGSDSAAVLDVRQQLHVVALHFAGLIALAGSVAFCLSAVQILPSIEATRLSERAAFNRPRNVFEATAVLFSDSEKQPLNESRGQSIWRGLLGEPERLTHHEAIYEFSIGPWRLAELLWPNVGGRMFPINRRWFSLLPAEGRVWSPTLYLGLLPAVLGIGSLLTASRSSCEQWLKRVALCSVVGSLGLYGIGWLLHEVTGFLGLGQSVAGKVGAPVGGLYWLLVTLLPGYAYFRYPAKLLPIAALAVCQLAAQRFVRDFSRGERWIVQSLALVGSVSFLLALIVRFCGNRLFNGAISGDPSWGPFDAVGARHDLTFSLLHAGVIAVVLAACCEVASQRPRLAHLSRRLALILTCLDVWIASGWTICTVSPDALGDRLSIVNRINTENAESELDSSNAKRILRGNPAAWRPESFRQDTSANRLEELTHWERATLLPRFPLALEVPVVESFGSLPSADLEALLYVARQHGPRQRDKSLTPQPTALRLLGTKYLVLPERHAVEFATRVERTGNDWPEGAELWRMNRTYPRAWIVHQVAAMPTGAALRRKEFLENRAREILFPGESARDFLQMAIVEANRPLAEWSSDPSLDTPGLHVKEDCRVVDDNPHLVIVETELARAGLLVLNDTWYPGWTAVVHKDGQSYPAEIYRANGVLRGVWLNAGKQTIDFRFHPQSFYVGAAISAISWLIAPAIGLWRVRRNRGRLRRQME